MAWSQDRLDKLIARCRPIIDGVRVNRQYEVPLLAGADRDLRSTKVIYVDKDLPRQLNAEIVDGAPTTFAPDEELPWHEISEWLLMEEGDEDGVRMPYDEGPDGGAHGVATQVENWHATVMTGLSAVSYEAAYRPWIKKIEDEKIKSIPPRLYRGPYQSPDEKKYLDELVATTKSTFAAPGSGTAGLQGYDLEGAPEAGKSSKVDADYVPGPVADDPCRECSAFVRPAACTKVSGAISPGGHCRLFDRGKAPTKRDKSRLNGQTGLLLGDDDGDDAGKTVTGETRGTACAGVALNSHGEILFLRRGADQDHPGEWCFPGGKVEFGETPQEGAVRELREETGITVDVDPSRVVQVINDDVEFTTFMIEVGDKPEVRLSPESSEYRWADLINPPGPLHPWVMAVIPMVISAAARKVAKSGDSVDMSLNLFVPIVKVDAAQRLVYGTAASETPDHVQEVFDYATSKPLFQSWSDAFHKATDGKSVGNVRSMHGRVAAGKLTDIGFDDAGKRIEVAAKIVDNDEWRKVQEGVYTGFSIGGKYVKRWRDGDHTRYTAEPSEISLVDNPCIPNAMFSMIKEDGSTEMRKFKHVDARRTPTNEEVASRATSIAKSAGNEKDWTKYLDKARSELEADSTLPKGGKKTTTHDGRQGFDGKDGDEETIAADKTDDKPGAKKPTRTRGDPVAGQSDPVSDSQRGDGADSSVSHKSVDVDGSWEQVWVSKRLPGKTFSQKSDLRQALLDLDADEVAKKKAAPVIDALKGMTDVLDKRDGGSATFPASEVFKCDPSGDEVSNQIVSAVRGVIKCSDADWSAARDHASSSSASDRLVKSISSTSLPLIRVTKSGVIVPDATADALAAFVAGVTALVKRDYTADQRNEYAKQGVAMKDGSYPIPDKDALKDAVDSYGRSSNKMGAKRHIIRRAKALGATDVLPDGWNRGTTPTGKALGGDLAKAATLQSVSHLVSLLGMIECCEEDMELAPGKSPSFGISGTVLPVPKELCDRFGTVIVELGDIAAEILDDLLTSIRGEERNEAAIPGVTQEAVVAQSRMISDLVKSLVFKVGAKHAAADKTRIKQAHDLLVQLDSDCCDGPNDSDGSSGDRSDDASDDDASKATIAELVKRVQANDAAFQRTMDGIGVTLGEVAARVKRIEATPLPSPPSLFRIVEKVHDGVVPAPAPFATGPDSVYEVIPGIGRVRVTVPDGTTQRR